MDKDNAKLPNKSLKAEWKHQMREIVDFANEKGLTKEDIFSIDGNKEDGYILTYFEIEN